MKNFKIGLSVGVPLMSAFISQAVLAQDADSPPSQAANWVCTLQVANPMPGMDGETPLFCVQWTEPFYAKAIGGMEGMSGMSGMSGMDGMSGMSGMGGMSGMSGMDGMSGMSGQQGGYSVTLSELSFGVASATLGPRGKEYIRQQMAALPIQPQSRFKIIGHTDNVGSADSNLTLSFERAKAVKAYFVANGIDKDLIEASGQGESAPIASNDTPEGRKKNRRVEVIVY